MVSAGERVRRCNTCKIDARGFDGKLTWSPDPDATQPTENGQAWRDFVYRVERMSSPTGYRDSPVLEKLIITWIRKRERAAHEIGRILLVIAVGFGILVLGSLTHLGLLALPIAVFVLVLGVPLVAGARVSHPMTTLEMDAETIQLSTGRRRRTLERPVNVTRNENVVVLVSRGKRIHVEFDEPVDAEFLATMLTR